MSSLNQIQNNLNGMAQRYCVKDAVSGKYQFSFGAGVEDCSEQQNMISLLKLKSADEGPK